MESMTEKAQYFAQYWGQNIVLPGGFPLEVVINIDNISSGFKLFLTPLSAITDEDAIEVSRMDISIDEATHKFINPRGHKEKEIAYGKNNIYFLIEQSKIADFLRSKSYALRWRDKSVEQLIELGWLKLKA